MNTSSPPRGSSGQNHATDVFFTLSLFCVFAAAAFIVIMIGIHVYQATVTHMQDTYSTRTAISYVAEKIRRHDAVGRVALGHLGSSDALVLTDEVGGDIYLTYIYTLDDHLCELTVRADASPSPDQGERIIDVRDFSVTDAGNGFLEVSAADSGGHIIRCMLHPRSEDF